MCLAKDEYKEMPKFSDKDKLCETSKKIQDYDMADSKSLFDCLHKNPYMDKSGAIKEADFKADCSMKNRFAGTYSYNGRSIFTHETLQNEEHYLNSAKFDPAAIIEEKGELIYKHPAQKSGKGFIVATNAPIGNYEEIEKDPKFKDLACPAVFAAIAGKDCSSGNTKPDGKWSKKSTVQDFYKALRVNKIKYIVQLTNFVEKTNPADGCHCKVKADKYFSFEDGSAYTITQSDRKTASGATVKTKVSKLSSVPQNDKIVEVRELTFSDKGEKGPVEHGVTHIHYKGWPDFGVPVGEAKTILYHIIDFVKSKLDAGENVIVHCTGGIGRTGTFITSVLTSKLNKTKNFNLVKFILELRKARPEIVETDKQVEIIIDNMKR